MRPRPRPLARVINPGVRWWLAVPCNLLACAPLLLLVLDPAANLSVALLGVAAVALYGTALFLRAKKER